MGDPRTLKDGANLVWLVIERGEINHGPVRHRIYDQVLNHRGESVQL